MIATYQLSCDALTKKVIALRLRLDAPAGTQRFRLPAWIPGSYMIRDFARHLLHFVALDAQGKAVPFRKTDKQTWELDAPGGPLELQYQIYANDTSVRGAHVDQTHVFFNGTSVFLQPLDCAIDEFHVELIKPVATQTTQWQVATALDARTVDAQGFGLYSAATYVRLIDCPVEIGQLDRCAFTVAGVPHSMVFSGRHQADLARIAQDLPPALEEHVALFGELPVSGYLFMTRVTASGYGGLEHADSTALMCARKELPYVGMQKINDDYQRYLGLCSHEYFHLWNVKRIQPRSLQQPDLHAENYTPLLWAFEGITSYYDDLALLRSGVIDLSAYLKTLAQTITRVQRGSGRLKQSVAESSFDAWTRFYQQDENAPNAIVSYYTKGALVALGLDVELRLASADRISLDDLMRRLWQRFGRTGLGVTDDDIPALCSELAGRSMEAFFADYVTGVKELPLERWLAALGIGYRLRSALRRDETGNALTAPPSATETTTPARAGLDALTAEHVQGARVTTLYEDGAAQRAGIAPGDILIALDGLQITHATLDEQLARLPLASSVTLHGFRDGVLMTFTLELQPAALVTCELWPFPQDQLVPAQQARLQNWSASKRMHKDQ